MRSLPEARDVFSPWKLIATTSVFTVSFSVLSIAFAKLVTLRHSSWSSRRDPCSVCVRLM